MKKVVALFALVMMVGFLNAQEISVGVKQKVDQKIAMWEKKVEGTEEQKSKIRSIMIKYESLIETKKKSVNSDRSNMEEIQTAVAEYKEAMNAEIDAVLTDEQRAKVKEIQSGNR